MGTTLELAREIRDHIVSHSTGRLNITFPDTLKQVDFSEGTILTPRQDLLQCLDKPPVDFEFLKMEIPAADELQSGAAVLVEALDALNDDALVRIWEPYRKWTILLSQDPDIHQTPVSGHLDKHPGRLRRLLRLAITGAAQLEPPARLSLEEHIEVIRAATGRGNYWEALGIDRTAGRDEIKHAHRELARQFHPDRWHNTQDDNIRANIEQAFRDVQYCYEKALKALPRRLAAVPVPKIPPTVQSRDPVVSQPEQTPKPDPQPIAPAVASYTTASEVSHAPDSLFRRIFDKFFKAA